MYLKPQKLLGWDIRTPSISGYCDWFIKTNDQRLAEWI